MAGNAGNTLILEKGEWFPPPTGKLLNDREQVSRDVKASDLVFRTFHRDTERWRPNASQAQHAPIVQIEPLHV